MTDQATATAPPGGAAVALAAPIAPARQTRVVEHAEPSEMPRSKRITRALIVTGVIVCAEAISWWVILHSEHVPTIKMIAQWQIGLVYFAMFLFIADANAQDVVRLVAAFKSTRKETITTHSHEDDAECPAERVDEEPRRPAERARTRPIGVPW